ncbi:hypothetical protein CVT26_012525 [Gymnopilus dilepis]|uniref:Uncharacterized protein n=1 Tax=Gymnopilus dilepis TaxID=231916 RepID=A0A409WAK1_9AGAR|nr:hypothetical protein CVT26_012525 [Gymnopilus dilepis]
MTVQHIDNTSVFPLLTRFSCRLIQTFTCIYRFGAAYIGVVVAGMLYGVSFVQTWYYFMKYRQDVWYIKTLVSAVWIFETVHQALISHTVYHYVITNYNNADTLGYIVWYECPGRSSPSSSAPAIQRVHPQVGSLVQRFNRLVGPRLPNFASLEAGNNVPLTMVVATLVLACFGCSVGLSKR